MSKVQPAGLYDRDFFAWTQFQARELQRFARTRPTLPLDLEHLAEEVRDLGKEQRSALRSWVRRIIEHRLLLDHSPATEPRQAWETEIENFRSEIELRLSATLKRDLERRLPVLFKAARRQVDRRLAQYRESGSRTVLP